MLFGFLLRERHKLSLLRKMPSYISSLYSCKVDTQKSWTENSRFLSSFHFRDLLYSPMGFMLRKKRAIAIVLFT
ncbi:hypothetical protein BK135_06290 [Paenibacillus peoriae]|nr:hypothetical protein BK135_06290 [Paenibacillus peoriae]